MGVYNHFSSKSGIVEALFVQGFERLGRAMVTLNEIADPLEALFEGGRRYRALALAHPMAYQLMFLRAVPGFEPSPRPRPSPPGPSRGWWPRCGGPWGPASSRTAIPRMTSQVIWAGIHGWVSLELCGIGFVEDTDRGADLLCAVMMAGLRPRSPASLPSS